MPRSRGPSREEIAVGQDHDDRAGVHAISMIAVSVLGDAAMRKSFSADPLGTLERAGIDYGTVPKEFLDVLADMSYEELTVVSRVVESMIDLGISIQIGPELLF
jgi:hypothetical protein